MHRYIHSSYSPSFGRFEKGALIEEQRQPPLATGTLFEEQQQQPPRAPYVYDRAGVDIHSALAAASGASSQRPLFAFHAAEQRSGMNGPRKATDQARPLPGPQPLLSALRCEAGNLPKNVGATQALAVRIRRRVYS